MLVYPCADGFRCLGALHVAHLERVQPGRRCIVLPRQSLAPSLGAGGLLKTRVCGQAITSWTDKDDDIIESRFGLHNLPEVVKAAKLRSAGGNVRFLMRVECRRPLSEAEKRMEAWATTKKGNDSAFPQSHQIDNHSTRVVISSN